MTGESFEDIEYACADGVATLTLARPEHGNMFRTKTALEMFDALRAFRVSRDEHVLILTGAGDKFFCLGGEQDEASDFSYASTLPIIDVYELIDTMPKPVIAAVNGFAVGGGQVLQTVCDLSIASENAIFRQVGPLVGSFDAGFGTWYLEATIGRKRAKEMWMLNRKLTAAEALAIGLVNEVVAPERVLPRAREVARELLARGPMALAALKTAFSSRHTGVIGQARLAHDQMIPRYYATEEADELSRAFEERRPPDRSHFNR